MAMTAIATSCRTAWGDSCRLGPDTIDFQVPGRPSFVCLVNPKAYVMRVHLEHLGRNVPRPMPGGWASFSRACLRPRSATHSAPAVIPPRRSRLLPATWRTASPCSQACDRSVFAEPTSPVWTEHVHYPGAPRLIMNTVLSSIRSCSPLSLK